MKVLLCGVFFIIQCSSDLSDLDQTLFERNLVKKNPSSLEILENYQQYVLLVNRAENGVLGFVSENTTSYENSVIYSKKFTYLTPLWFNIKRTGYKQYKVTGHENVNRKWMEQLIEKNPEIRITPRITFNGWTPTDFIMLASSEEEWIDVSIELLTLYETHHIHGLTLDLFDNWYGGMPNTLLIGVLQEISARLRVNYYISSVVVQPLYSNIYHFNKDVFEDIAEYVSMITIMTSNHRSLKSIENYIKKICPKEIYRNKLLFTIEFNGYATSTENCRSVTKKEYLKYLQNHHNVLQYDETKSENYFKISSSKEKETIFYPTLQSVYERVNLANNLRTGVAVLSVGDGLDYFSELL